MSTYRILAMFALCSSLNLDRKEIISIGGKLGEFMFTGDPSSLIYVLAVPSKLPPVKIPGKVCDGIIQLPYVLIITKTAGIFISANM